MRSGGVVVDPALRLPGDAAVARVGDPQVGIGVRVAEVPVPYPVHVLAGAVHGTPRPRASRRLDPTAAVEAVVPDDLHRTPRCPSVIRVGVADLVGGGRVVAPADVDPPGVVDRDAGAESFAER